jgi:hypothetical protein
MPLREMTPEEAREFDRKHPFNTTLIFGARPTIASTQQSAPASAAGMQAAKSSTSQEPDEGEINQQRHLGSAMEESLRKYLGEPITKQASATDTPESTPSQS